MLRREGPYSSHLTTWRHQRQRGELHGLAPAKRGRKSDPQAAEVARLQRENAQLQAQVERAELIIDVQKKLSQLLGLPAMPSEYVRAISSTIWRWHDVVSRNCMVRSKWKRSAGTHECCPCPLGSEQP